MPQIPNPIPLAERQRIALKAGKKGSAAYKNALNLSGRYNRGEVKTPKNAELVKYLTKQKNEAVLKAKKHKESLERAKKGKANLRQQTSTGVQYVYGPRRRAIPDNWIPIKIIDDDYGINKQRPTIKDCIREAKEVCQEYWDSEADTIFEGAGNARMLVTQVAAWVQPAGNYEVQKFKTPDTRGKTDIQHHDELVRVVVWIAIEGT